MKNILKFFQTIRNVNYVSSLNKGNRSDRRRAKRLMKNNFAR